MWDSGAFDLPDDAAIADILQSWEDFCGRADALIAARGDLDSETLVPSVAVLCDNGLQSLVEDHFMQSLEEVFKKSAVVRFWKQFDVLRDVSMSAMANFSEQETFIQTILTQSSEEICQEKHYHERCLLFLVHSLESYEDNIVDGKRKTQDYKAILTSRYRLMVSSILLATLPSHFPEILRLYFKAKLEELSNMMVMDHEGTHDFQIEYQESSTSVGIREMDTDCGYPGSSSNKNTLINNIGMLVRHLRSLGFTSMTEDAYTSAIFSLLKAKVHELAGDDYRIPVLESMKEWIQAVPLQFLHALLAYLGDTVNHDTRPSGLKSPLASSSFHGIEMASEGLIRWKLRLEYFAYETLQNLRIGKLFEIIVDYPDSCLAIEDLKECLDYTGQHSKLVDSFISSLRYRLLTAGASTNDILHQYVSTIKALRTIDPTGVFLEAVGEPIRDYLRGRKDTIKCIVTMLTDGTGAGSSGAGNAGDSLLEELNRDAENQETADYDDDINSDEKQAWTNSERWEPDPAEVDPLKGSRSRRKIDILGMIVSIIGSKDQLVSEYRVMLAEKLLNKCDYDIDAEIRTLELLKIHFGESSMQKCEIMMNDLIDSKRTNGNIRASIAKQNSTGSQSGDMSSLDLLNASIISSNFWPPIQGESLNVPTSIDQLLSDYSKRYHEIKAPRKLLWKKNLGMVKLELQFEDRNMEFTVSPPHAVIIMQFQEKQSWTSKDLAAAVGVPVDTLNRKINFWISKGVLAESIGTDSDEHVFTIVNDIVDANRTGMAGGSSEVLMSMDEGERSVASVEEQLQKEMTVYEKFIVGMLTNFGSMSLDIIHNRLKMFCIAEPKYDKSLQQLQNFLSGLISEEKLEIRDGVYFLKK